MALPLLFILAITTLSFVFRFFQWQRYRLPPGPYPLPIIGNLHHMEPNRALCLEKWSKIYGPIMSIWFGSTLNVVISSPELAKQVLKDQDEWLSNRYRTKPIDMMIKNGKDLVWADYGPHFVKVKKICVVELFSAKCVEGFRPIREEEVRAMIQSIYRDCMNRLNNGKSIILRNYLGIVTFNNLTRSVIGKRILNDRGETDEQGLELKSILSDEITLGSSLSLIDNIWWLNWIFRFVDKAFLRHMIRKNQLIRAIIDEHWVRRKKKDGATKQHFLDVLLCLQERHEISEDTMIELLWNMVTAGMDTSTIVVEWAMAELVKNPIIQHKAQEELSRVIGPGREMTELDIPNLPYLQSVIKETLRLHPPTPLMLPHKANTHVKIGGYDIPKGANVYVNLSAMGHDPQIWEHPLEFRPERFLEEEVDIKGNDFRLIPFGAGRRMCPAVRLSINLVTLMIGHLLHVFDWGVPKGVLLEDIDMSGIPSVVNYMTTPLQLVPIIRKKIY